MTKTIAFISLALLCAACASTRGESADAYQGKEYRTGSNLPARERTASGDVKTIDRQSMEDMQRLQTMPTPIKTGN